MRVFNAVMAEKIEKEIYLPSHMVDKDEAEKTKSDWQ